VTCPRIDMPRKTEKRRNADWTGDEENGQHLAPRNHFLLVQVYAISR
jgi:hypothetical protein